MYRVTIINDGVETTVHSPHVNSLKLLGGVIRKEVNAIDRFTMQFTINNPAYGKLKPFKTFVKVLNTKTGKYEFEGRVLQPSGTMSVDGMLVFLYECEGELGYLHDAQQRHLEYRGTPKELFTTILDYHNQQVEPFQRFEVGNVAVTNTTDNQYVYLSAEQDTYETIFDKLINRLGGELQIRKVDGVKYLDLLPRVGQDTNVEIRLAKNLREMSQAVDPTEIITRLTPLGTRIESDDEEATDASQARLTIESVNNGIPYLDDTALIEEFGIQGGSVTWDDITLPENLLSAGLDWLANQKVTHTQYEVSAVDLFLIGLDSAQFEVGNGYPVRNPIMNIDEVLRVVGKTIDINQPENNALKIGDKFKTLNDYQAEANKSTFKIQDLESTVNRQSQTIALLKDELGGVESGLQQVEQALAEGDIPALQDAIQNLTDAVDNLTDAVNAIQPVTETTDGLMLATDKVKLNRITVLNAVDLDNLVQRVVKLENEVFGNGG